MNRGRDKASGVLHSPRSSPSSAPRLPLRRPRSSVAAESLERPQQLVLPGSVRNHVAVLLQQDAVQRALVVDVTTRHQDVLPPFLQLGAVAHVGGPQELAVLQAEAVAVAVHDLDVVARLLASVQLPEDSAAKNFQETKKFHEMMFLFRVRAKLPVTSSTMKLKGPNSPKSFWQYCLLRSLLPLSRRHFPQCPAWWPNRNEKAKWDLLLSACLVEELSTWSSTVNRMQSCSFSPLVWTVLTFFWSNWSNWSGPVEAGETLGTFVSTPPKKSISRQRSLSEGRVNLQPPAANPVFVEWKYFERAETVGLTSSWTESEQH